MRSLILNFLLINILSLASFAGELRPKWTTDAQLSDSSYYYIICSHDGLDPEEVKQIAENKCLASAAKLGSVEVKVTQKTIQSLTGSDSAEVAEIKPLHRIVSCEWMSRFVEKIESGFRVWLKCRVTKKSVKEYNSSKESKSVDSVDQKEKINSLKHKRAILIVASVPTADRLIILNDAGERAVVEVKSNTQSVELKEGDKSVLVKKQKYIDEKIDLDSWANGDSISKTVYMRPEM